MSLGGFIQGGLSLAGAAFDLEGGRRQRRRNRRLFAEFQKSSARDRDEQLGLEAIARGELAVSLADADKVFRRALKGIALAGEASGRRFLESVAQEKARRAQVTRQRGLTGSTAGAVNEAIIERERFRGGLDAEARKGIAIADVLGDQLQFERGVRGDMARSRRREGEIIRSSGREVRDALQDFQVGFTPVSGALSTLGAELGNVLDGFAERRKEREQAEFDLEEVRSQAGMDELVNNLRRDAGFSGARTAARVLTGLFG